MCSALCAKTTILVHLIDWAAKNYIIKCTKIRKNQSDIRFFGFIVHLNNSTKEYGVWKSPGLP